MSTPRARPSFRHTVAKHIRRDLLKPSRNSKYKPHQGDRERMRRMKQIIKEARKT